ncbi:MAG: DUF1223 domain-containing protein [Gammaproteobacteria bacterium]|nr:DUF1223 domain-containing protein [Gammaproteobacteria bacterium]
MPSVMKPFYYSSFLLALTMPFSVSAGQCHGQSAEHKVALLELYTSEGCSSCPPADRWLSNLAEGQFDSQQVVPLALHVDYWNYLGWKDPFSSKQYSKRQRHQGDVNNLRTVYTPQFVLNGEDLRGWYKRNGTDGPIEKVNAESAKATIHLTLGDLTLGNADAASLQVDARVELADEQSANGYGLYLALFENELISDIPRGENSGKTLHHDYVVRKLMGPYKLAGKSSSLSEKFSIAADWTDKNLGVAAFVQNAKTGDVLQALMVKNCS